MQDQIIFILNKNKQSLYHPDIHNEHHRSHQHCQPQAGHVGRGPQEPCLDTIKPEDRRQIHSTHGLGRQSPRTHNGDTEPSWSPLLSQYEKKGLEGR